jgi:tetratricopeptide (TPR) repeat protein
MNEQDTSEAFEMANKAIALDAAGDRREARLQWQKASDHADRHLLGEDIYYWIKSGFGAALFEDGEYERSIAISELALDWCRKINQPLPSLTIAKAYLKLGDRQSAVAHVIAAHRLIGDDVFDQLDPADREVMRRDSRTG